MKIGGGEDVRDEEKLSSRLLLAMSDMSSVRKGVSHKSSKPSVRKSLGLLQSSERIVEGGGGAGKREVEDKLPLMLFFVKASFCLQQRGSPQKS